jgi:ribonuclease P/MRP protein subunit POP5
MNKKIKPILPSLREKKRYLVFEVISKQKIQDFNKVRDAIMNSALEFLGQLGMAKAGVIILKDKWNKDKQRGILRVNNKHVDNLKAALTFVEKINGADAIVRSVGVSGILKKAENKYLN